MNLANNLTLARILLSPVFVLSVIAYRADSAVFSKLPAFVFISAVLTDALDGFFARRMHQETAAGRVLDPLADKLLLASAFITLSLYSPLPGWMKVPGWVAVCVVSRDVFILLGAGLIFLVFGYIEFRPTSLGKTTTFFQMVTVLGALFRLGFLLPIWIITVILTVTSGAQYFIRAQAAIGKRKVKDA